MVNISSQQIEIVRQFEKALIDRNYQLISQEAGMGRVTASEIDQAIEEYGGVITIAPNSIFDDFKIIQVKDTDKPTWAVDFDLWIDNKKSDLTMQIDIIQYGPGNLKGYFHDIHVL